MLYLLLCLWLFRTSFATLESSHYWQLKEYRWDRMKEFIFQQKAGHGFLFNTFHVLMLAGLVVFGAGYYLFQSQVLVIKWVPLVFMVIFLAESLQYLHRIVLRTIKRPRLTGKSLLVLTLTFLLFTPILFTSYYVYGIYPPFHTIAIILASISLIDRDINALAVSIANGFSGYAKGMIYQQAQSKILSRRDLTVIGITGSFGKSSVKEFLSHILSGKFEVLKTEKNTNTEIGIAQTVLKKLKPHHKVFVCEMGAYHKGEIQLCCQIARPKIGIFTGLNEQHLALFGSLDDTFSAKWELISSLPADGLAVFNGDSPELASRLQPYRGTTALCTTRGDQSMVKDMVTTRDSIQFTFRGQRFTAPLIGEFQVVNILMGIVVAEHLGMTLPEIAERVKTLEAPEKTMNLRSFKRGFIIDDSYNVNPDGLRAALKHLSHFEDHTKIIFFPGVLELGEASIPLHELMGEEVGSAVDYTFFTDPSFSEYLSRGAFRGGLTRNEVYQLSDQESMKETLKTILDRNPNEKFVILFESRGAERVMESLSS